MNKASPRPASATNRDNPLWLKLWKNKQTDFHQQSINTLLQRFWPGLNLASGSRIFVPLCGKSMDILWLAQQGHTVIGVELSPVAVKAFFSENGLKPSKQRNGAFTEWRHGRIRILCGDFFALTSQHLGQIDQVYDRAALTALPEDIRTLYVAYLREIIDQDTGIFLLTTEDSDMVVKGLQSKQGEASGIDDEVAKLFKGYRINQAHSERATSLHSAPINTRTLSEHKLYCLNR